MKADPERRARPESDSRAGRVGFLHPGAMGAALAGSCAGERCWLSAGRSEATRKRAESIGMTSCESLAAIADHCETLISICPPHAAEEVAEAVAGVGFDGIYVDANAIAPATARRVGERFEHFVDAGIIGPPPRTGGTTRLYLSGEAANGVSTLWTDSPLEVRVIRGGAGAASAVKVCFAAWTKGNSALLLAIRALADAEGVTDALVAEWTTSMPDLIPRADRTASGVGPKAWRFAGEMEEIAAAFDAQALPKGFHLAAAEVFRSLTEFKDRSPGPELGEVLAALGGEAQPEGGE